MASRKLPEQVDVDAGTLPPGSGTIVTDSFAPGRVIGGKYRVDSAVGEGGAGVVLKGTHVQLDRPIALKHLKPSALQQPTVVERFMREARLAAKITNEHAVKVHDVDSEGGIPYLVMELLEGRDLEQIVAEAPLGVDTAIDYVLQACEAIAEAHAAGIVHRDLKPGNLFLASRPGSASIVKVLDFGISRVAEKNQSSTWRVTQLDERIGTPVFMSPEQLQGSDEVDARSDIWSLGVVLYELVSGKLPFEGDSLPQLCVSIVTKPPVPLASVRADAPPELETIIFRCLNKEPANRYQNVAELANDLARIWGGEAPSRVQQISSVLAEAGQAISPPEPPPITVDADADEGTRLEPPPIVEDHVLAVFSNGAGDDVDQLEFLSIDEAYEYAASLETEVVRCDLYDAFEGVRGKLRVTYVRKAESGHWVPLFE